MTMPYQIITDSSCDLPQELADSYGLIVLPLSLTVDHKTYKNYLDGREIGFHELYEKFRSGSQTSTCAVNPEAFIEVMEPCLKEGRDIFYIGFSSGLSTTYQSGVIAASELREKYPERKIMTIDSLCASLGQGLFVHYAVKKQREGASMEELSAYLEALRLDGPSRHGASDQARHAHRQRRQAGQRQQGPRPQSLHPCAGRPYGADGHRSGQSDRVHLPR